ncbi:BLUF domain-containing protein [Acinetobacter pittii]|uniref:BLUF domain-containing protein n=1 Tax=Acinetobacter pittii TaxID=48296 RepID=UPI002954083A|nr:BLUF domain-containing protein [Acinetobacter pittii]MDV7706554.1 BLUF domain-containing protein [Acinetobacter pittii]MDV7761430.1 BLUF domain-containing protein [Acinetobacter pittii]
MSDVRMLYVSKLKECDNPMNELFNILTEALNFNTPNLICGALYYGNGFFVQCLEGDKIKINELFHNKILNDRRHENCELIYCEDITDRLFSQWHMKYAIFHKDIVNFFAENNIDEFNPYTLSINNIPDFINLLSKQKDSFYTLKPNNT